MLCVRALSLALVSLLSGGVGCTAEDATRSPTNPPSAFGEALTLWEVSPQPGDLATDIGDTPLAVIVRNAGHSGQPTDDILSAMKDRVSLRDSLGRSVPSEIVIRYPEIVDPTQSDNEPQTPESELNKFVHLELKPSVPQGSGWYSVRVSSLPERVRAIGFHVRADGDLEARFTAKPIPVFREVELCQYAGKGTYVTLTVSEPLEVKPTDEPSRLSASADGNGCRPTNHADSLMATQLEVWCADGAKGVDIAVRDPITAMSGASTTLPGGGTTFALSWPSDGWVASRSDCWVWRF